MFYSCWMISTFNKCNIYIRVTNVCTGSACIVYIFFVFGFCIFCRYRTFWEVGLMKFWSAACPGKVSMDCDGS